MKENKTRKVIIEVINLLDENQYSYIDPAEHIYDAQKVIKRHLNDKDLITYVGDFIKGLSSSANGDFDGTLDICITKLNSLKK